MKNKTRRSHTRKTPKIRIKSFFFSLKFFAVSFTIMMKILLEILIQDELNYQHGLLFTISLCSRLLFFMIFLYLDLLSLKHRWPKSCPIKKSVICLTIFSENFLIIYFRLICKGLTASDHYTMARFFWDSQALSIYFFILTKSFPFRQQISLFIAVNTMIIIMLSLALSSPQIGLSVLNFLPNIFLFALCGKGILPDQSSVTNADEICGFINQGFMLLSKEHYEILYVSQQFSSGLSILKTVKYFEDVNANLYNFEEEKMIVYRAEDQSLLASLDRNSSRLVQGNRFKTRTFLMNTSQSKTRSRTKFQSLKELLDSSAHNYDLFLEKKVERTFLAYNSAHEKKIIHIKNVSFKKKPCFWISLENAEQFNVLVSVSKEKEFQSRLLSSFSHEMRTPLNGSIPILEDIMENLKPCCRPYIYENIFSAMASLRILENTINDIIDFQALHSGEFYLNIQEINIKEVFQNVINLMKVQAEKKGLTFISKIDAAIPSKMMSDSNRIQQLLINLLGNAIKFTKKGFVEMQANIFKKEPELLLQIKITDSGLGIEEEKMTKLQQLLNNFEIEKMQFLESTGCSFGLILSQNLAKALGSEEDCGLKVETKENEGSCFTFYIVDREDEKRISSVESRLLSLEMASKNLEKISRDKLTEGTVRNPSNKTRKSGVSNCSPNLRKLRETTYQRIKSGVFAIGEEFGFEDECVETPHHYLSQKIILINENTSLNKHFMVNSNYSFSSPLKTEKHPQVRQSIHKIENQKTLIQTQGSVHECTCNKILVVDDCIFNIKTMELLLQKEGLKCDNAFDGFEAIEKFKNKFILKSSICGSTCLGYRLIFMDYQMPQKDGVQAAHELQELIKEYNLPDVPIICCTAFDSNSLVTRCFQAGMKEVIFKPVNINFVRNVLRTWFR